MLEKNLKTSVKAMIKRSFPQAWCYKTNDRTTSGIPDLIICMYGRFIAIELKTAKGKVSPIQDYTINAIKRAGGYAVVARTVADVKLLLEEIWKKNC